MKQHSLTTDKANDYEKEEWLRRQVQLVHDNVVGINEGIILTSPIYVSSSRYTYTDVVSTVITAKPLIPLSALPQTSKLSTANQIWSENHAKFDESSQTKLSAIIEGLNRLNTEVSSPLTEFNPPSNLLPEVNMTQANSLLLNMSKISPNTVENPVNSEIDDRLSVQYTANINRFWKEETAAVKIQRLYRETSQKGSIDAGGKPRFIYE